MELYKWRWPEAEPITVRIKQIQLEQVHTFPIISVTALQTDPTFSALYCQDTAKSTFDVRTQTSRIDLNRAGAGLMEIVSEPDIR